MGGRKWPGRVARSAVVVLVSMAAPALAQRELEQSDWFGQASEAIRTSEYRFSPVRGERGVWSAPNRGQGLRSRVAADGLEVFPRSTSADGVGPEWTLQLGTKAFGRDGDLRAVPAGEVTVDGDRVELDRGALVEWFVNGEEGIEQGWTIRSRPGGVDPLVIVLAVEGDLTLRLDEGGRSGRFVDAGGVSRIDYAKLVAWDGEGRELEAQLVSLPEGAAVRVEDAGAAYPVTVDPLLSDPAWTAESNQASAFFGWSVSTAGDVNGDGYSDVVVGATHYDNGETNEGAAFVYHGSPNGLSAGPDWTAEGDQTAATFGSSVGMAGDVNGDGYSDVVVGASAYDGGEANEGRAYVYHGSVGGLSTSADWTAESNQADALFGNSVATAGDVNADGYSDVIVGAHLYDDGEVNEGRAYVYHGSAGGLSTNAAWTAESNQVQATFGQSVSTVGDVNGDGYSDVIIGADDYDNGTTNEGGAFVYHGSASGLSTGADWMVDSGWTDGRMGYSVGAAGDVNGDGYGDAIVGVPNAGVSGWALVYLGSPSGLPPFGSAMNPGSGAHVGVSVSTAGDVNGDGYSDVIIGNGSGSTILSYGSPTGITGLVIRNSPSPGYGISVSTAGDVDGDGFSDVIVGAHMAENGEAEEGLAYVYRGSPDGLSTSAAWTAESDQTEARYGWSVSTAGDVNGDGYSDVVVGSYWYDNGETDEGAAFLYHGSASGPSATPDWMVEPDQAGAEMGHSVSTAGDVNGDGYSDVIVGARLYDDGETDEGRAYVYLGSSAGVSTSAAWTVEGDQADARCGLSVSTAGDVDGDGFSDVIIGVGSYDNGETDEGQAWTFHGSPGGLLATPAWVAESNQAGASLGRSVATAGDVNGDGYSDVVVGAHLYDNGQADEGRTFVYHGSPSGLEASAAWTAESDQALAEFGHTAGTAGDVNGDGYSDVIVGAQEYAGPTSQEGRAWVYHGSPIGLAATAAWIGEANQITARYANQVSTAGDVNGDGYSDVIVGARHYDSGQSNEGRAYVYLGSASGLATGAAWIVESGQAEAQLGRAVATAGDVNGDGYADVIVGAGYWDGGQTNEGHARIYYGNGGDGGWVLAPTQRGLGAAAKPVGLLGNTDNTSSFRIWAQLVRGLAGFDWATPAVPMAKLEWRVRGITTPYDSGIDSYDFAPIGATPMLFEEVIGGLPDGELYRWEARFRTNNPLFPVTPWFTVPWNGRTEAKLRTPPFVVEEPGPPEKL